MITLLKSILCITIITLSMPFALVGELMCRITETMVKFTDWITKNDPALRRIRKQVEFKDYLNNKNND